MIQQKIVFVAPEAGFWLFGSKPLTNGNPVLKLHDEDS